MKLRVIRLGVDEGKERAKIGENIGANSDGGLDIGSIMTRRERDKTRWALCSDSKRALWMLEMLFQGFQARAFVNVRPILLGAIGGDYSDFG